MISQDTLNHNKQQFEDALLELMEQMPYTQITIVHLIKKVNVSRKTFYRYFPDKDACLRALVQRYVKDSAIYTSTHATLETTVAQSYPIQLRFWKASSTFLTVLIRNDLIHVLQQEIMNHIRAEEKDLMRGLCTPNGEFDEDCLYFFASGMCRMLTIWCASEFRIPMETVAQKLERLLHMPLIPRGTDHLTDTHQIAD